MTAPLFVHLRLHSEYSIADGTVRVDDAVAAAAADGMPALALTDLANAFGLVKFYKAARARGLKPVFGVDAWITHDAERDAPFRALLLAQSRQGYLRLADWLSRAWRDNAWRGRAEFRREWFDEGTDGLIALSGARDGDVGHALLQGNAAGAAKAARDWSAWFPDRYYLEVQRAGHADDDALVAATVALAGETSLPVVATHPVQYLRPEDFRAHEARVCIAEGYVLADPRRPRRFTTDQHFRTQAEMAAAFADLPEALANSVAIARRCNLTIPLGKNYLPAFPTPPGVSIDEHLDAEARAGLERRLALLYPDAARRDERRPEYVARLEFETRTIAQMGFPGYFLIVADFINWAKGNGVPVGPGRGSGAGSLVAYALGITDLDPLRYQLLFERFLNPERVSMPDFDIDFCQDGARSRHRLRQAKVRRRQRRADRHLRHDGGEGRGARRRPRARPAVQLRRRHRQADPVPAGQADHAQAGARDGAAAGRAREERGGGPAAAGARRGARGADAQRRHARGRRADRAGQAHRFLPAVHAVGRRRGGVAVRQGRRRGGGAGQVRLPRPHDADHPRLDGALREAPRPGERDRAGDAAARRQAGLRRLPQRRHRRGVPVRIARHARPDEAGAADAVRGHHRAGRAVPARSDGADPGLRRPQDRPRARRVSGRAPRAHPRSHVRRDGVPGTGDADRPGDRRLHARRGRPAAPRDGQEEGRGNGHAPRHLRRRRREERGHPGQGHAAVRPDGEVRRLRVQQVARGRVRAGRLPDRVVQGAPSGRVHGGQPVAGDGRHRQGPRAARGHRPPGALGAAARRQRVGLALRAGRPRAHPLRTGRHQGHRRAGDRVDRRGARRRRAVPRPLRLLPARRQAAGEPPRRRGADPRRRVRFDRCPARHAVRVGGHRARRRRAQRRGERPGLAVRRRRRAGAGRAGRDARMDRRRAADAREVGARLLPFGPSLRELRGRAGTAGPHAAGGARPAPGPGAHRRHRRRAARPERPPRQDGVRDPRRRRRAGGGRRLQRDLRRGALAAARGPAGDRRGEDHAADGRRRRAAGHARRGRGGVRPARRCASGTPRACVSPATAAPTRSACSSCCRRSGTAACRSSSSTATTA